MHVSPRLFVAIPALLVTALTLAGVARAQSGIDRAAMISDRPHPEGVPTEVEVNVFVVDVTAISDVDQDFTADLYFLSSWVDPRLAGDSRRTLPLDEVWHPRLGIVNERGLESLLPRVVTVEPDGTVSIVQRFIGTLSTRMDLRDFPFDRQTLKIRVVSYEYTPEQIVIRPRSETTMGFEDFSVAGWGVRLGPIETTPLPIPGTAGERAHIQFEIGVDRDTGYYRWTVYVPLIFIVLMAWMVFWIDPSMIPPQVGLSTASVFTLIAFRFSVGLSLPAVAYMTLLDRFILGCTILVFLALGQAIFTGRLVTQGREARARALDAWGRWIYLALFIVLGLSFVRLD